jgi:hypothetical protein
MTNRRFTYSLCFASPNWKGEWRIQDMGDKGYCSFDDPIVWTFPWAESHDDLGQPPPEVRAKYEELLRESGWKPEPEPAFNIVEMITDAADCAFDQPCAYGRRVESHAVYCHNETWLYAPSKCRRHRGNSVWGDKPWPHEECPGFKPRVD